MRESDTENRGSRRSPELYDRLGKGQYERKKNSRGTRAWPCETCTEPWLWAGKGIRWSSSGVITRQHGSVAALPHRLRVCRPRLSNQGVCFLLRETQCAAMADAVRCDGTCTALRFSGHCFPSVRRAGPMVQLDLGHRPYNPAHASCIFCFIGAKNTTDISAHSSPLSKENLFKLPSRTGTLSIRGSPNHQQGAPLCSKKTPRSAAKPHTLCPKKFY